MVYRLNSAIVSLEHSATGMRIWRIAEGTLVAADDLSIRNGLLEIQFAGRTVAVFAEDFNKRAEPVEEIPAAQKALGHAAA